MSKRINGEDILLAIGDVDDELLAYPEARKTHYKIIKPLSIAASLIICLSIVISFYAEVVFKGANKDDAAGNDSNSSDAPNSPGADGIVDMTANVYDAIVFAYPTPPTHDISGVSGAFVLTPNGNGIALARTGADGKLTIYIPQSSLTVETSLGEEVRCFPEDAVDGFSEYKITAAGTSRIYYTHNDTVYSILVEAYEDGVYKLTICEELL